ncbi:MAG: phage holin family protein [Proteobacteria bacterium]|nr:phage holin family protein [Pseudomonadota bacterium]
MNRPESPTAEPSQSISGLWHQLTLQLATLLRQELTLARTELYQSLMTVLSSVGTVVAGIVFLYVASLLLLVSAVAGLATLLPLWLAALSLGGGALLIGMMLVLSGRRHLKQAHLAPAHLGQSLKKDKDVLLRKAQP